MDFLSEKMKEKSAIRALIIDDEIEICYLLSRLLKSRDIEANYVGSLSEARSILKTYEPSIIFLDNHLPDGLGVEFINYIKAGYPEVKVIIITAHDTNVSRAWAEGASEVVFKPFTSEKIFSLIEEYS